MPGVANASNKFAVSPYIVDPTAGNGASYTKVADAIAAASAAGGGHVYIKNGTFVEDITLADGVTLEGATPSGKGAAAPVVIDGLVNITAAGTYGLKNIRFERAAAGNQFEVTNAAGAAFGLFDNCSFNPNAGIALLLNSGAGASGGFIADNCDFAPSAASIGVSMTRGSLFMNSGSIIASGAAAAIDVGVSSVFRGFNHADITGGTSSINVSDATGSAELDDALITGGTAAALNFAAAGTMSIYHSRVSSSGGGGSWAAGAAGTLNYGSVLNLGTDLAIAGTLTVVPRNWQQYGQTAAAGAGSVRGTISANSAEFTLVDGFLSLAGAAFIPWQDSAPGALTANNGYFATGSGVYTLPAGTTDGQTVELVDIGGGGAAITAAGVQLINIGNVVSSAGGTATSTAKGDAVRLKFRLTDVTWYAAPGVAGTWNLA